MCASAITFLIFWGMFLLFVFGIIWLDFSTEKYDD